MSDIPDRFYAPPPTVIPKDATRLEELRLRFGAFGPPRNTQLYEEWLRLTEEEARR